MAKPRLFMRIETDEPENHILYSFNDTLTDEEGHQTERMEYIQDTTLYGMDPLEQMIMNENLTELLNYIKSKREQTC